MKYEDAKLVVGRELHMQLVLAEKSQVLNIPCLMGPPGIGKTAMARALAKELDLEIISINVGENADPTDVAGIPVPETSVGGDGFADADVRYIEWRLNRAAALACDRPVFLFFDDIDKGPPQIFAALLAVFGNRTFRDRNIHRMTRIMAAGNRVGDDVLANPLSESLLTRVTTIELDPDVHSFAKYGLESGDIHPMVIGFLLFKPELLHAKTVDPRNGRDATPRCYWEASQQFNEFPNADEEIGGLPNWKGIVQRKCGHAVANDFWAWYSVLKDIDLPRILETGTLYGMPTSDEKGQRRMWYYALAFRLVNHLIQAGGLAKKEVAGFIAILKAMTPELAIAIAIQLPTNTRVAIADASEEAGNLLTAALFPNKKKV